MEFVEPPPNKIPGYATGKERVFFTVLLPIYATQWGEAFQDSQFVC